MGKPNYEKAQDFVGLWSLLHEASYGIMRCRQNELRDLRISMIQAALLFAVKSIDGPATPAEISRWLFREQHTVFVLVKNMEKQGLVKKMKHPTIKHQVVVILTKKGEETYRRSIEKRHIVQTILSSLSSEERANLWTYLETLRDRALQEMGVKYTLPIP